MKRVILVLLVTILSFVSVSAFADLSAFTAAAHNFSRIQALIDQHRSIVLKPADNSMTGGTAFPSNVADEARNAADSAESWGCDLKITERPPTNIQMGQQTITVVPFTITYEGQACPIKLTATMDVTSVSGQANTFKIITNMDFTVDPSKIDQFGFQKATGHQEALVKFNPNPISITVGVKTAMDSDGGPNGHVHGEQGLTFTLTVTPPMNIQAVSEVFGRFILAGKTTTVKQKMTLSGLIPTSQYYVDDVQSDQKTYDGAMQGLQFFGLNEEPAAASSGTLSCVNAIIEAAAVTAAEQMEFKKSGTFPQAAPSFSWKVCGQSSTNTFAPYQITNHFDTNWLLMTIKSTRRVDPVNFYVLYDEDSHFVGALDHYNVFVSCKAAKKCERR